MTEISIPEKEVRVTVSHSEVESYLRCERQHFYGYGLEIQRINESDSLRRGTLGHAALEVFFNSMKDTSDFEASKVAAYTFLSEYAITVPVIMSEVVNCLGFFFEGYPFHGWEILGVEYENVLSVTDKLAMPFVIDLIVRDLYGDVWVVDHKFMYDFLSDHDVELMPQIPKYMVGMKAVGFNVDRAAYSIFRYRKMKEESVDNKYLFKPIEVTVDRMKQTILEQVVVSDRIQSLKHLPIEEWSGSAMRTANKMVCNSCSFRSLCVAELNNWQPNLILNGDYMPKKRREFKEIEQQ